jgi:acid-sensing ion channel, other
MPNDAPHFVSKFFNIPVTSSINFVITPNVMSNSDEIRSYPLAQRNCYFSDERRLKYFKHYTQTNCEIDCYFENALQQCGCLPMEIESIICITFACTPIKSLKISDQNGIDTCGPARMSCLRKTDEIFYQQNKLHCNCLPGCPYISFDSEVSMISWQNFNLSNYIDNYQKECELNKFCDIWIGLQRFFNFRYHYSEVNIYFSKTQFLSQQRNELHGNIDFLANCGGLLGLCLGMSVLSLLEIVYFGLIHFWFNRRKIKDTVRKLRKNHPMKSGIENLPKNYMRKTTIQGIKYVARSDLSMVERFWWTVVVILSVFCCGSLINAVYKRYDESPVQISFAQEETPNSQVEIATLL